MNIGRGAQFSIAVRIASTAMWLAVLNCGNGQSRVVANDSPTANENFALLAKENGLFVSSDAERLTCQAKPGECIEVSFVLHETYPGRQVISEIRTHLTNAGWKPLTEDWLNPRTSSPRGSGWIQYVEETGGALRDYWMWQSAWQDAKGDLIRYSLRYSRPFRSKVRLSDVSINGNWMSAAKAQADRDSVKRARHNATKSGQR
jgi:hypothetical protein